METTIVKEQRDDAHSVTIAKSVDKTRHDMELNLSTPDKKTVKSILNELK